MSEQISSGSSPEAVEQTLQHELSHGDVLLATARPILRHLLSHLDQSIFSDQVLATVRGMMIHVARQMAFTLAESVGTNDRIFFVDENHEEIALALLEEPDFLAHAHALTIEANIADRLAQRSGIDAVLSPLMQELAASAEQTIAADAMHVLAAQARFMQQQRRMELPLNELPETLFERAMGIFRDQTVQHAEHSDKAEKAMRDVYKPNERRVGRILRLISAMRQNARRALDVDDAGLSIFVTALGMAADQDRDTAILSLGENQFARLALSLRAAGLSQSAVEEQFLYLHPEISLPDGFETIRADRAAAMLHDAQAEGTH